VRECGLDRTGSRWSIAARCNEHASFEASTEVMFQVEVFWVVTPCSVVVGYQRFRGPCCLHLWVVTPSSVMVGYQRFRGPGYLHIWVVTLCSVVVGHQSFRDPCYLPSLGLSEHDNEISSSIRVTISFSRRTLIRGFSYLLIYKFKMVFNVNNTW
jgi:hypothetical protein